MGNIYQIHNYPSFYTRDCLMGNITYNQNREQKNIRAKKPGRTCKYHHLLLTHWWRSYMSHFQKQSLLSEHRSWPQLNDQIYETIHSRFLWKIPKNSFLEEKILWEISLYQKFDKREESIKQTVGTPYWSLRYQGNTVNSNSLGKYNNSLARPL